MTRLLIALLATALLVAGCGGDDEGSDRADTSPTAQAQAQTPPTDTADETTTTDEERGDEDGGREDERAGGDDSGGARPPAGSRQLEQAVEACKQNVQQAPQLSEDAKEDLVELCEQAATGDPEELRKVSREVCRRIISDTLPAGEQREQALRLCDQTGEQ